MIRLRLVALCFLSGCTDWAALEAASCEKRPELSFCTDRQDAGTTDAGAVDAGAVDAGAVDAGAVDAGAVDAGAVDAGAVDAGAVDAGARDAGARDAGAADAGADGGVVDGGARDSGTPDASICGGFNKAAEIAQEAAWIRSQQLPNGAILTGGRVTPYFANVAATSIARDSASLQATRRWLEWYFAHLELPSDGGIFGTVPDYLLLADGGLLRLTTTDADDSAAATVLTASRAYFENADDAGREFIFQNLSYTLNLVGGVMTRLRDDRTGGDRLTWARDDYHVKYFIDAVEVERGLRDLSTLNTAFAAALSARGADASQANYDAFYFLQRADEANAAIEAVFWRGTEYAVSKDSNGTLQLPNPAVWYPDSVAQLAPQFAGVDRADGGRALLLYQTFKQRWPNLRPADGGDFPWVAVALVAARTGDCAAATGRLKEVKRDFIDAGHPWPWYVGEAAFYVDTQRTLP